VLLAATAIRDGQPFHRITALAITFDEPISPETFRFTPPTGEKVHTSRTGLRERHHLTLTEAQQRAPLTVLMPDAHPQIGRSAATTLTRQSDRPRPRRSL
jgi:hypothetical protein